MRRGTPRSPGRSRRSFGAVRELRGAQVVRARLAAPLLLELGLAAHRGLIALLRLEDREDLLVLRLLRGDRRRPRELLRFLQLRTGAPAEAALGLVDRLGGRDQLLVAESDDLVEERRHEVVTRLRD